jgi:hypothetical protein
MPANVFNITHALMFGPEVGKNAAAGFEGGSGPGGSGRSKHAAIQRVNLE